MQGVAQHRLSAHELAGMCLRSFYSVEAWLMRTLPALAKQPLPFSPAGFESAT